MIPGFVYVRESIWNFVFGEPLKKEVRIHNLMSVEIVNLTYDYSDGTVSEYIGLLLNKIPEASWTDLLQQLTTQYIEYVNAADATGELELDRARGKRCPN